MSAGYKERGRLVEPLHVGNVLGHEAQNVKHRFQVRMESSTMNGKKYLAETVVETFLRRAQVWENNVALSWDLPFSGREIQHYPLLREKKTTTECLRASYQTILQ